MPAPHILSVVMHVKTARQRHKQTHFFAYLGEIFSNCPDVSNHQAVNLVVNA